MWDYPRPPAVEPVDRRIRVRLDGRDIVDTTDVVRVLETSHPPVYYVPRAAVGPGMLIPSDRRSFCEFKGVAHYLSTASVADVAWYYPEPAAGYESLTDRIAFYASRVEACYVDDERVDPQAGDFYGGWITKDITGPFKGAPGTGGW